MKIFVVEPYARTPGHYDRLALRTCEAFTRLQNCVTLVTYCGITSSNHVHPLRVLKACSGTEEPLNGRSQHGKIYRSGFRAFIDWQARELRTLYLAASVARKEKSSIFHFYDADPVLLSLVVKLVLRRKQSRRGPVTVVTVHQISKLEPATRIHARAYRWVFRCCLRRLIEHDVDGTVVLDPTLKHGLVNYFKLSEEAADRIRVLPHGIGDPIENSSKQEARQRLNLDPDETIFLTFGVLRCDKRIDLAIEAFKSLCRCQLVIAGGPQDFTEQTVQELVRAHGCEQSVSYEIGYIPEKRMHDYFSACDAVIVPYDKNFKGLSGILTLACGHEKPVIASDVSLLGETVKKHQIGFAVEPDSAPAIREAVLRFLALTPEERGLLEQQVRSYAMLMNWDSVCQEWVNFYQELLSRRNSASQN